MNMEKDEQLQRFFQLCKNSSFPHREELIDGIKNNEIDFSRYSQTKSNGKHFLGIYTFRAKRLANAETESGKRLNKEVLLLCENLKNSLEDEIGLWVFCKRPNWMYGLFENIRTSEIVGCTLGTDKRIVSEGDYERYLNE